MLGLKQRAQGARKMSNDGGISSDKAKKLLETVSFELDTDLRLLAHRVELGKAELLTDAIRLPFQDIEKQLARYALTGGDAEREHLKKQMKNYLARLNANPLLPLHFRLKVLDRFERELDLFDGEMTAAVLNAHKIGIELVQKAARENPDYLRVLVDMAANALELAVRLLRIGYESFEQPHVLALRQAFEIARLGLVVAEGLSSQEEAQDVVRRLYDAVANHELLRRLDFCGKSRRVQGLIWKELQHHIAHLAPRFFRRGAPLSQLKGTAFLLSRFSRLNRRPEVLPKLPAQAPEDCIVIPLAKMIDRLIVALDRVQKLARHLETKKRAHLITEEVFQATLVGGQAILEALRDVPRRAERKLHPGARVVIEWDAARAILESRAMDVLEQYEYAPLDRTKRHAWAVVDISANGVGLERINYEPFRHDVGSLVALSWIPHRGEPTLGIVRWFKEPKHGEQKLGIEFVREKLQMFKGAPVYAEGDDAQRKFPVLLTRREDGVHAIIPQPNVHTGFVFSASQEGKQAYLKVVEVLEEGPNYTRVRVVRAESPKSVRSFETASS